MMKIRDAQVRVLERTRFQQFVLEMMTHLRTHFPEELASLPDWELGEEIEGCLGRAATYGITSRRDCARYLALAACFGWSFDTELKWPAQMLQDPTSSPSVRLERVHERCLQRLDQEATTSAYRRELGL
ncbi:hypothetical protein F0U60_27140 [Archangium minus]|uniref:Transposase n=1 Tax=Archangium minus TaxID=83450 RepID=A0ABY9WW74_9BACT|nr:hypothetical protein F0U60_27140 [Archangium minus]